MSLLPDAASANTSRLKVRPRLGYVVVLLAWALFSLLMAAESVMGLRGELLLRSGGVHIAGDVVAWRGRPESGQLKYVFHTPLGPELFSMSDRLRIGPLTRTNLWVSVPPGVWSQATATGKIDLLHMPSNPWLNRPALPAGNKLGDALVGIAVAGAMLGIAVCIMLTTISQYRHLRRNPPATPVRKWLFTASLQPLHESRSQGPASVQ